MSAPDPPVAIPNLVTDPIWSVGIWPVEVSFAGQDYEIAAMPAKSWLALFMDLDLEEIFPGLVHADAEIYEAILAGEVTSEDVDQVALDVVTAVSGRPWWVALRLIAAAKSAWASLGPEMISRVDADRVSISAWLDVLLVVILERLKPEDTQMFAIQLEAPPPELREQSAPPEPGELPSGFEMDASTFMAMAGG